MDPAELLKRINKEADRAAEIALSYFGKVSGSLKKDRSYVTAADLEIEEYLRGALPKIIEGSIVVGEETEISNDDADEINSAEWVWVIDPIDGTAVFIDGLPFFCVSIALARNGEPYAGLVRFPATDENYEAVTGYGAYYNGNRIEITEDTELLLGTPLYVPSKAHIKYNIAFNGKCRSLGSTACHILLIARGVAKGSVSESAVWDYLGAVAILQEAGGTVRYLDGSEIDWPSVITRHKKLKAPVLAAFPGYWESLAEVIKPGLFAASRYISNYIEEKIRLIKQDGISIPNGDVKEEALSAFKRMCELYNSIINLEGIEHYEAVTALAALLYERYMDFVLLSGDTTGEMDRRYCEFIGLQKYRSAHRMVSFHEESEGRTPLDVELQKEYKKMSGGIEEIRKRVAEVWGPDNRGKSSYPVHWSGRKCTRVISSEMGVEYEQLYIEAYAVLNWLLNSGLYENRDPDTETREGICEWAHYVGQLTMLEAYSELTKTSDSIEKPEWLDIALKKLRDNPGKALNCVGNTLAI